ncbi:hypothetical protein A9K55_000888 [Cordyceps militaris]|uniref:Uncharacterized protein n=1 Tax=Cordyceps militaris TaxID=73501 RepID=A0A2H4STK7_CORMI|nr:hypothetical protein A9K55_000888 [Cordyceps militaris]
MPVLQHNKSTRGCQGKNGSGSLARELQAQAFVVDHVEADENATFAKPVAAGSSAGKSFSGYQACTIM